MTAVPGLAHVEAALRRGVRVVWDPPRYRGPAAALALVKEVPETAREVLRRAEAFRAQIDTWVQSGRAGVPLLVLPEAPAPQAGVCVSCGGAIAAGHWRCRACVAAVELALGLRPPRGLSDG